MKNSSPKNSISEVDLPTNSSPSKNSPFKNSPLKNSNIKIVPLVDLLISPIIAVVEDIYKFLNNNKYNSVIYSTKFIKTSYSLKKVVIYTKPIIDIITNSSKTSNNSISNSILEAINVISNPLNLISSKSIKPKAIKNLKLIKSTKSIKPLKKLDSIIVYIEDENIFNLKPSK